MKSGESILSRMIFKCDLQLFHLPFFSIFKVSTLYGSLKQDQRPFDQLWRWQCLLESAWHADSSTHIPLRVSTVFQRGPCSPTAACRRKKATTDGNKTTATKLKVSNLCNHLLHVEPTHPMPHAPVLRIPVHFSRKGVMIVPRAPAIIHTPWESIKLFRNISQGPTYPHNGQKAFVPSSCKFEIWDANTVWNYQWNFSRQNRAIPNDRVVSEVKPPAKATLKWQVISRGIIEIEKHTIKYRHCSKLDPVA